MTLVSITGRGDLQRARVCLPASGKGGERGFVAATTAERKGRDRSADHRGDP